MRFQTFAQVEGKCFVFVYKVEVMPLFRASNKMEIRLSRWHTHFVTFTGLEKRVIFPTLSIYFAILRVYVAILSAYVLQFFQNVELILP